MHPFEPRDYPEGSFTGVSYRFHEDESRAQLLREAFIAMRDFVPLTPSQSASESWISETRTP